MSRRREGFDELERKDRQALSTVLELRRQASWAAL